MEQVQTVSDSELILMRIIWENGGIALYAQIADTLKQKNLDWKKNTIITLLSRLVEKKLLITNKIGRRNEYKALVTEQEYNAAQTKRFVERVYEGDMSGLIGTLLKQDMITDKEKEMLRQHWEGSGGGE